MQIAILGWGSLVWDSGDLRIVDGEWRTGGPELPIELSRLSENRRHLTYVIDERHTRRVPTRYAISKYTDLEEAIADLASREGCAVTAIGYVDTGRSDQHRARPGVPWKDIEAWATAKKLGAAVWTDLPPNFQGEWNLDQVVDFWKTKIPADRIAAAKEYASRAPPEVDTDLRRRLVIEKLIPPAQAPAD